MFTTLLIVAAMAATSVAGLLIARDLTEGPGVEVVLPVPGENVSAESPDMKIYLSGAVESPGVYAIEKGDRPADLLASARLFLVAGDPAASVISLGENNRFGHPHPTASSCVPTATAPLR